MFRLIKKSPIALVLLISLCVFTIAVGAWLLLAEQEISFTSAAGATGIWSNANCTLDGTPGIVVSATVNSDGPVCVLSDIEQITEVWLEAQIENTSPSDICYLSADLGSLPVYVTADPNSGIGGSIMVGDPIAPGAGAKATVGIKYYFNDLLTASLSDALQVPLVFDFCP